MKEIPGWGVIDGKVLRREFTCDNFAQGLAFVNNIGKIAEEENHHPDIELHYKKVVVTLTTHNIGGLSENDFILAAKIDNVKI